MKSKSQKKIHHSIAIHLYWYLKIVINRVQIRRVHFGDYIKIGETLRFLFLKAQVHVSRIMLSHSLFQDKVAVVTGASTGVGEAIATALFEKGALVFITSRHLPEIQQTANRIDPTGKRVFGRAVDVTRAEEVKNLFAEIEATFGSLHHLVNNAGITGPHNTGIENYDLDDWKRVIDTNINGMFYTLKYALPLMESTVGSEKNCIETTVVNLSAVNGIVGIPGISPYTASKHAVAGITQSVALEYAQRHIRINAVAPGYVSTPRINDLPPEVQNWMATQHPMQRMASLSEVSNTVLFLLSTLSSFTTGVVYPIDGGYLAQ